MKRALLVGLMVILSSCTYAEGQAGESGEPDYAPWNALLTRYYNPNSGMTTRDSRPATRQRCRRSGSNSGR